MTTISNSELFHQLKISGKIPELIHGILQRRVLETTAQELAIEISDQELQSGADRFRASNKLESANATERWLQDRMLTVDDFEQLVTTNLLTYKVAERLFDSQVAPYFHQHILDYAAAIIYELLVTDKNLAIELYYAIQEGDMTFGDVAKRYGQTKEIQQRAGYQGLVPRQKMLPEVSAAVFAAQPPQILEPIATAKGIYLIWVEELVQPQLDDALREQIRWELFQEWLQKKIGDLRGSLKFVP
jgi:parvulin-like peptidyl-prolyl isomerase